MTHQLRFLKSIILTGALPVLMVVFAAPALQAVGLSDYSEKAGFAMPKLGKDGDIQITANHMGADKKTNRATLDGDVLVKFSDITLTCDRATYDSSTGDIHAEGDVRIVSRAGGSWSGDAIDFNHRTGEGLVGTGVLKLGTWTVEADSMARDDDGVFHAQDVTLTTCTNHPSSWHWSVTGTGRYKDKEFVELRDVTARLFGVPVLWAPYYYRDFNTHYGWRFMPGYTGKWGAYLSAGYVYPIFGTAEWGNMLYGKTVVDLRSKFGVGVGQELTWKTEDIFGDGTRQWGRLSLYYAHHKEDQEVEDMNWGSAYDEQRWSIGLTERLDFTPRDFISITGEAVSDSLFREDYKELAVRSASQPLGIANYEHRENGWVTSLALMGPLNSFYAGVRRLPELRLDTLPKSVFGNPNLFYESQTSIGMLERQPAKYDGASYRYRWQPGNWAYYDTLRIDTRHLFRRPYTLAEGVTLTPRFGWRGTYYTDSPDGDALFRSLFEFGINLQARYWRDYETVRHTVVPYLDLLWVPGSQEGASDQPYAFDRLDQAYEWRDRYNTDGHTPPHRYTGVRLGMKNLFQKRTDKGLSPYFNADLYGIYVLQTQDHWVRWNHRDQPGRKNLRGPVRRVKEKTGLRVLGLSADYTPFRNFIVATDFQFDPEESRLALWDIHGRYRVDSVTLYAGFLMRDHEVYDYYWTDRINDAVLYGGFIHHLSDIWDWSLYLRHNIEHSDLEEIGGFVQYNLDCISFRLNLGYLPSYTSEDGYNHESDFRISLGASLRAFTEDDDEDWMQWGDLANRVRLEE